MSDWDSEDEYAVTYEREIEPLKEEIMKLKEQIEKMKCCANCKYMEEDCEYFYCTNLKHVHDELKANEYVDLDTKFIGTRYNQKCNEWEMKE